MIRAQNVRLQIGQKSILSGIDISVTSGECVGLIGRNGAGKTSLLRTLMAMDDNATGFCNLWDQGAKKRAMSAGWLAQERSVSWDMDVEQIIALGRIPWQGFMGRAQKDDQQYIQAAVSKLKLDNFLERPFHTLSGGERARVLIARLLAQNTPLIMADEPIAALDPANQLQVMSLFRALADDGRAVILSIHDLTLAARYCTRLILMDQGKIIADGNSASVLNDENLARNFGIKAIRQDSDYGLIIHPIEALETIYG